MVANVLMGSQAFKDERRPFQAERKIRPLRLKQAWLHRHQMPERVDSSNQKGRKFVRDGFRRGKLFSFICFWF